MNFQFTRHIQWKIPIELHSLPCIYGDLMGIRYYNIWDYVVCSHWCLECMSGDIMEIHGGNVMKV